MARTSNQAAGQITPTPPQHAPLGGDRPDDDALDRTSSIRIPFQWRLVFMIWAICFVILVLYELSVLIGKLFM